MAGGFARRWHCLAANHGRGPNLGSGMEARMHHKKRGQQVEGGDSVALLCFCETPPECCVQLWGSHSNKNVDLLERGLRRAMKMLRGLETG